MALDPAMHTDRDTKRPGRIRLDLGEASASVADLGTLVPILAALVLVNGVDAATALALTGTLFVVSGIVYRVPLPVQPIKAAAAIAIATHASPRVIAAAGLLIGLVLVLIALARAAPLLLKLFPVPLIRGNQLGVGILLVVAAARMARADGGATGLVAAAVMAALVFATAGRRAPVALALVLGGVGWSLVHGAHAAVSPGLALPALTVPSWVHLATAMTLLVIPQLPLTLGNAIVGTAAVEREYYGARARRVTERNLCLSSGVANVAAGLLGGMPLCHGSSGATAYRRLGGRTGSVGVLAGVPLVVAGLIFGGSAVGMFALIPGPVLAALLAYTGMRHAALVADQRGRALGVALAMGVVGGITRNLSLGMAVGLPAYALLVVAPAHLRPALPRLPGRASR